MASLRAGEVKWAACSLEPQICQKPRGCGRKRDCPNTPDRLWTLWGTAWALGHSTPSDQSLPPLCILQVKQIMEEAVTRKFVHEDSSHIISFCGEWWPRWRQWGAASWEGCVRGDAPGSQLLLHDELCDSGASLCRRKWIWKCRVVGEGLRMPPVSHGGPSRACPTLTHPLEARGMASVISLWVKDGANGNCLKGVMRAGAQLSWQDAWLRGTKPWIPSPATHSMHGTTRLYHHTAVVEEEPEV